MQLQLKVCGLREPANVRAVAELGADYLGFIFYRRSPRFVGDGFTLDRAALLGKRAVGVFVNQELDEVVAAARACGLDGLQLHGDETAGYCRAQHAHLHASGRVQYAAVTDDEALHAALRLARTEGIIPALESSHALAYLERLPAAKEDVVVVCLEARGRFQRYLEAVAGRVFSAHEAEGVVQAVNSRCLSLGLCLRRQDDAALIRLRFDSRSGTLETISIENEDIRPAQEFPLLRAIAIPSTPSKNEIKRMSADQFFWHFDNLVGSVGHDELREQFQAWLTGQVKKTLDTFDEKRRLARNIQQRLRRLNLQVECPKCKEPANFRCVLVNGIPEFEFAHPLRGVETKHARSKHMPLLKLRSAPRDPRVKKEDR